MTERVGQSTVDWETIYPNDEDRRRRVNSFVDRVSLLERLQKIVLIRFESGGERLYLFFDPALSIEDIEGGEELGRPTYVRGKTIMPAGFLMTNKEMDCITDSLNEAFCNSGLKITDWPVPVKTIDVDYVNLESTSESLRSADKFTLWERPRVEAA